MKIVFVVPELNLTGGLRVIAIYAQQLSDKGHDVTVVSPNARRPTIKERLKQFVKLNQVVFKSGFDSSFFKHARYNLNILDKFRPVIASDVPDADIIIATYWSTAEWIASFPKQKGQKCYFIQHFEMHPWLPVERVRDTFFLPYKQIAVASWIKEAISTEVGKDMNVQVVPNGVDLKQFNSEPRGKSKLPTVGFMYSSRDYKGCDIAINSILEAQKIIPSLNVISFGTDEACDDMKSIENLTYYQRPEQTMLKEIYKACDAWIFSSRIEGFGLPILEAMACRTPVIGTMAGAAPDLIKNGGGYLCEIDDVQSIFKGIIDVCELDNDRWIIMSTVALETAKNNSWIDTSEKFEEALIS